VEFSSSPNQNLSGAFGCGLGAVVRLFLLH